MMNHFDEKLLYFFKKFNRTSQKEMHKILHFLEPTFNIGAALLRLQIIGYCFRINKIIFS